MKANSCLICQLGKAPNMKRDQFNKVNCCLLATFKGVGKTNSPSNEDILKISAIKLEFSIPILVKFVNLAAPPLDLQI